MHISLWYASAFPNEFTLSPNGGQYIILYIYGERERASIFIKVHLVWAAWRSMFGLLLTHSRSYSFSLSQSIYFLSVLLFSASMCAMLCCATLHLPTLHHFCSHSISHFTHLLAHHVQQIIIYRSCCVLCCAVLCAHTCYMWIWINITWFGLVLLRFCILLALCTHYTHTFFVVLYLLSHSLTLTPIFFSLSLLFLLLFHINTHTHTFCHRMCVSGLSISNFVLFGLRAHGCLLFFFLLFRLLIFFFLCLHLLLVQHVSF